MVLELLPATRGLCVWFGEVEGLGRFDHRPRAGCRLQERSDYESLPEEGWLPPRLLDAPTRAPIYLTVINFRRAGTSFRSAIPTAAAVGSNSKSPSSIVEESPWKQQLSKNHREGSIGFRLLHLIIERFLRTKVVTSPWHASCVY